MPHNELITRRADGTVTDARDNLIVYEWRNPTLRPTTPIRAPVMRNHAAGARPARGDRVILSPARTALSSPDQTIEPYRRAHVVSRRPFHGAAAC